MEMRIFLLVFVNLLFFSVKGQIIDIPDARFKNALVNTKCVDTNEDGVGDTDADLNDNGEIDVSEAEDVKYLLVNDKDIFNLQGIEYFKNLEILRCQNNQLTSLNVLGLKNLRELHCNTNDLNSLDVAGLSNLTSLYCGSNQLTSLDVSGLHNLRTLSCNSNQLTSLDLTGSNNLITLTCGINQLTSLDLTGLSNLTSLYCGSNQLTSLDVSSLQNLQSLSCGSNKLTSLDLTGLQNLQSLSCGINQLTSLDLTSLINLIGLHCSSNQLTSLNLSGLNKITSIDCGSNQLTSLVISNLNNLVALTCNSNELTSLDFSGVDNLTHLKCDVNQLTSLDLKGLNKLATLECSSNKLISLDLTGLNLTHLYCRSNQFTSLDLIDLNNLTHLDCSKNQLSQIDVNSLSRLESISCSSNNLRYLFVKNGGKFNQIFFNYNDSLEYICCNEDDILKLRENVMNYNLPNCEVNSYCTFNPGGKFYAVAGQNVYDYNNDGCDEFDVGLPHLKFNISNGIDSGTFLTNSTGNYYMPMQAGTHTIIPTLEVQAYFEITPALITATFPSTFDTITQNFCVTVKEPHSQIDITIIPLTPPARPGFDAKYKIIWENKGNLLENGTLHFAYDENIFDYMNATLSPDVISSGKVSWDYTDLLPFEKREITVTLNLNSPVENPPVNAGDVTQLHAYILDNIFTLENTIVGSYDPNDKTCLQGNYFHPDSVGKYVDFLIRFENTGNYAAENIVVKDIIDDKVFDVSSLVITDASHEMYTRIAANKVEFIFENIQLPFEDEHNDGYVAFKIKTKSTLKLGDKLKNLADIYFDYNFPIRTNETQTTIAIPTHTKDEIIDVIVYPNPVRDILFLEGNVRWQKAEIYDLTGRLIRVNYPDNTSMDVSAMQNGTYLLKLSSTDKTGWVKFVKM